MRITSMSVVELAAAIRARELSPLEATEAFIARAEATHDAVHALALDCFEDARSLARRQTEALRDSRALPPLFGVPFTVKDCLDVKELRSTCGLTARAANVAESDAFVVEQLREAGGVLLGKTNLPDNCWSAEADNPVYGLTSNPWRVDRSAGGSSGGSGALVAAEGTAFCIGSDIAGSIRIPAVFNGVVGLRVTSGTLSERGMWPPTVGRIVDLEALGPLTKRVADAALLFSVLLDAPVPDLDPAPLEGERVASWTSDGLVDADSEIAGAVDAAVRVLEEAGMKRVAGAPKSRKLASIGWCAYFDEAARDAISTAFGAGERWSPYAELARAIQGDARVSDGAMLSWILSDIGSRLGARFLDAPKWRTRLRDELRALVGEGGIAVSPVRPTTAPPHGWYVRQMAPLISMSFTTWVNLAGLPALAVPIGISDEGLPIGVQLVGAPGSEPGLLAAGAVIERAFSPAWRPAPLAYA